MSGIFPDSGGPATNAQNSLIDPDVVTGCTPLWHSSRRCSPRFDPASANAMMSEMLNLVAAGGNEYDCDRLDNLATGVADLILDKLFGCMERTFPSASGACQLEVLALRTDADGCKRISRYSQAASQIGTANNSSVWGTAYPTTAKPATPMNAATYYSISQLTAAVLANTVNEGRLTDNHLFSLNITIPCNGTIVEFAVSTAVNFAPDFNLPAGGISRLVIRIDNVFPINGAFVDVSGSFSNFTSSYDFTFRRVMTAGPHTVDFYVVAESGTIPAQVLVLGSAVTSAGRVTARVAT